MADYKDPEKASFYRRNHRKYIFCINRETDADVVDFLDCLENRTEFLREACRREIRKRKGLRGFRG